MIYGEDPKFKITFDDKSPKGIQLRGTVEYKSDKIQISEDTAGEDPVMGHLGLRLLSLYIETRKVFEDDGWEMYQKKKIGYDETK